MKARTFAGWLLAGALSTVLCVACSSQGDAGHGCVYSGGLLSGSYSCTGGLVCNIGRSSPTCESPNANAAGGPCGENNNCKAGLWCDVKVCADLIGLGQTCPSGAGCASGFICSKMVDPSRPVCAVDNGGGPLGDGGGGVADASDSIGEVGNGEEDVVDAPVDTRGDVWCEGPPCPTPIFTPAGGKIPATAVTITVPGLPNAVIHYTTDGTLPTSISPIYSGPIFVMAAETIFAFAVLACVCTDSNIAAAMYTV